MKKYNFTKWTEVCNEIAQAFIEQYFYEEGEELEYQPEWSWIANDVGGCLECNEFYFNLSYMIEYMQLKYTKDEMFENYDYELNLGLANKPIKYNKKWWLIFYRDQNAELLKEIELLKNL
jgi:hypothetical protein